MMFRAIVGGACGVALLGALAACGSNESGVDEVRDVVAEARGAQDESSATTVVPAGEASAQLGVARWEGYADAIYGFENSGKVVAEFHSTDRGLESVLPEAGLLTDAGSGFSELTQRYYDAFSADAQSVVPDGADASAAVAASGLVFVDCYLNLASCFRDRDLIFQQTRIVCVCQPPDLDQFCGTSLVDLECNL